ncbi:hypothetical protein GEV33_014212 [Tenebrio molitor]|uniref:Tyrosine-protein phosphatase domain-containing protein n=1 Tax=Tenebrio molitor TaxID=7067 RepID=A0A8J6L6S4_TENMO|nr:hypothetical protein GEV33_014212 [Tenebrio molitor]
MKPEGLRPEGNTPTQGMHIIIARFNERYTGQQFPPFWPEGRTPKKYGPVFTIDHISHNHYTNIKTWVFRINKKIVSLTELMAGVKAPPKTVQLFQLTCWPMGHKVPTSTNSLVELMNMVERWRQRTDYGPVCVVSPWYKNLVDRSYRGPRPRRDKTVKKMVGGCCLSLWRRRGRQDGVALEYDLSTEKPPSYGSCSDDDVGLETARGPPVELPPIAYCRPVRVHVCFNLKYRLHPKGERMLSQISYQAERGEDGRSRCGIYCAANACIEQVIQHGEVDIFQAVRTVRRHRPQLIENITEYKYCYDVVLHYVLHYLQKDLEEIKVKTK